MTPTPGDLLAGRYRLDERLGAGGMAQVFRAQDEELHRDVAVKILAPHLLDDPNARERFRREARSAAALTHPHVVTLFDTVVDGDEQFLVMELVDGPSLADRLSAGPMSEAEALRITDDVAAALEVAHARGLIHCDIKPANLLLTADGAVKVADFGIARAVDATQTTTGQVYGSVPYIAPERAQGLQPDARSDLYALGCVLFEMLTGRPPFAGATPTDTLSQHLHAPPPAPSELRAAVSPGVDAVVSRLLAKDPADRPPDATGLRADLARVAAGGAPATATLPLPDLAPTTRVEGLADAPTGPVTREPARPGRRRFVWAVIALALLAAIGFALARDPVAEVAPAAPTDPTGPAASPTPSATAPSSAPATPPEPTTPEDAVAELRRLLSAGREDGLITDRGVDEIDKRLAETLKKLGEGKPGDAAKEVQDLRKKVDDLVKEGDVDPGFGDRIQDGVADLTRLVRD